jgi:hypothetical protein
MRFVVVIMSAQGWKPVSPSFLSHDEAGSWRKRYVDQVGHKLMTGICATAGA